VICLVDIKILESTETSIKVLFKGVDRTYVNAIRRFCISDVPTLAIDQVVIYENTSILYDELIAHRLGLIPIRTDLDRYTLPENCDCENPLGCNKCMVVLELNVESTESGFLACSDKLIPDNPEAIPVDSQIPIAKLANGQKLKLQAYAKLGRGNDHAKWQAVTTSVLLETDKEDEFILKLDSSGALNPETIIKTAINIIDERIQEISNLISAN